MDFTHKANPVQVRAVCVTAVSESGRIVVTADSSMPDGEGLMCLSPEQIARHTPVVGDYIVTQEDGYVYVNPKDVFERKYSAIPKPVVNVYSDAACVFQYCPTPNICQRGGGCINAGAAKA